jgi:hypothetical protein
VSISLYHYPFAGGNIMKAYSEEKPGKSFISGSPEIPISVTSMSPEYPKYRDALIIGIVVCILAGVLIGGYFFTRGFDSSFREFTQKPLRILTSLTDRYEVYKVCESFLRRNEGLFLELGHEIRFSLDEEVMSVSNGEEKTMTMTFKAHGRTETKDVIFQLKTKNGDWRIIYVGLERRNGQYRTLYPR